MDFLVKTFKLSFLKPGKLCSTYSLVKVWKKGTHTVHLETTALPDCIKARSHKKILQANTRQIITMQILQLSRSLHFLKPDKAGLYSADLKSVSQLLRAHRDIHELRQDNMVSMSLTGKNSSWQWNNLPGNLNSGKKRMKLLFIKTLSQLFTNLSALIYSKIWFIHHRILTTICFNQHHLLVPWKPLFLWT